MDGNGRWAAEHGVSVADGHRAGSRALRPVVETAIDLGIESLVVYAFSTENWSREAGEVGALMEIFGETIDRELEDGRARVGDGGPVAAPALDRLRLRRPRRARGCRPPAAGERHRAGGRGR